MRATLLGVVLGSALLLAGCGGSGGTDPVMARTSAWVKAANAFCLPRDRAIHKAELAAAPAFYTREVAHRIHAEVDGLRKLGVFRRIPLVSFKWGIAKHVLRESHDAGRIDEQLYATHRAAEPYGIRCRFGALPLGALLPSQPM